jgi:class 3 adenylate cyclase/PAS domain-containing protein
MATAPPWHRIARDPHVLRRAFFTSLGVGTLLTVANHWDDLTTGRMPEYQLLPIAITYAVPFLVSIASGVIALRVERRDHAATTELLESEIEAINKFPDANPNPVLRMAGDGRLAYANTAAAPILGALGVRRGDRLPPEIARRLREDAAATPLGRVEIESGRQTFSLLAVRVPELDVYNLYGTDVTGSKVVERFPDRNPNPVLRLGPDGELRYANAASAPITRALGIEVGAPVPAETWAGLLASLEDEAALPPEVSSEGRTYRLRAVRIPEFDFINVYGTDVTAIRAIDRFPRDNPNPVLRLTRDGRLTYGNPASELVQQALGATVGDVLGPESFRRITDALGDEALATVELEAGGRIFSLRCVRVFEFDWINLYGTDITAARQVEQLNADNERLLLNILPASIAERLRGGETVIADRFDHMAVLFADVVGFTELSSALPAHEVVDLLNSVFTMCDQLADRFGLEKIKTVGDAYMVVGGLRTDSAAGRPGPAPAVAVADMAVAMLDGLAAFREATGRNLHVRVGMHVGPAVAGVIGMKKFIYDVWGDTVNTASRMESTGVPDRVQVTTETYAALREKFTFESRGEIEVKGKGTIPAWLLVGRR